MSKPEEVALAIERKYGDGNWSFELREAIFDAILSAAQRERQECAKLAMAAIEAGDERHEVWLERYDVAISIASAIRKRGEEK